MGDITRRSLLSAGAWSVPVVAIAVSAPAAAASVTNTTYFYWTPDAVFGSTVSTVRATIFNDSDSPSNGAPLFSASIRGMTSILSIIAPAGWSHAGGPDGYDVYKDTPMAAGELVTIDFELAASPNRAGEILYGGLVLGQQLQMSAYVRARRS